MRNVTVGYIAAAVESTLAMLVVLGILDLTAVQIAAVLAAVNANSLLALYVNDRIGK